MKRSNLMTILALTLVFSIGGTAEAGWEEGVAALKSKNYEQAAREFQGVTEQHPDWPDGYYMLGQSLLKLRRSSDALNALRKAYDLKPNEVKYQYTLGKTYAVANRFREAAELLGKVDANALPAAQRGDFYQTYAAALTKSGQGDQAIDALGKAAAAHPNDADSQYNYGAALFNVGRTGDAVNALGKAVQLDGKDATKLEAYINALQRQGRQSKGAAKAAAYQKATGAAKSLVEQKPSYENYLLLGEAQLGASQYGDAVESFKQASARKSSDWLPYFYSGQAYFKEGDFSNAESSLKRALSVQLPDKDKKRVWGQLGFVYTEQKRYKDAAEAYTNAGDTAKAAAAQQNSEIAAHNQDAEKEQAEYNALMKQEEEIKRKLQELEGGKPPRR